MSESDSGRGMIFVNLGDELWKRIQQKAQEQGLDLDHLPKAEVEAFVNEFMDHIDIPAALNAMVTISDKRWPTMDDVKREVCPTCELRSPVCSFHMGDFAKDLGGVICPGMRAAMAKDSES